MNQSKLVNRGNGRLLKTLIFLSFPTVIEQILSTLLQYVDTAMVGRLGEQATASVSITTNVTWLVNSAPSAIGTAALVLVSSAKNKPPVQPGEIKCFSKNRTGELNASRACWRKGNLQV